MIWLFLALSFFHIATAGPALQPEPVAEEAYGEAYTAVASLDDGSFVLLQLMFTNAGVGSEKAACRALWVPPGQAGINASERFGTNWSYNDATKRLEAGTCSLSATETSIQFSVQVPELTIALDIQTVMQRVQPPGHRLDIKKTFYEAELLVPYAKTKATITRGDETLSLKGAVHLDHARSNLLMPNAAKCWIRFRGFFGSAPTLLQVRVPPDDGAVDGWVWPLKTGAAKPVDGQRVSLQQTNDGLPSVSIADNTVPIDLDVTQQLYRYKPTESYGALGKLAAPWIGNPTTTTYRAKGRIGDETTSGIMEVLEVVEQGCGFKTAN